MTTWKLTDEQIRALRTRRAEVKGLYGERNRLFERYEEIYFMENVEKPKDAGVDERDWKVTASPNGRDKVTGLKRILDTSEIHITVKEKGEKARSSDKIEAGLKTMLRVSGEYKSARPEKDTNLAAVLYGPVVLAVDGVDDLITAKTKDYEGNKRDGINTYVLRQLETIRKRTPFLIDTINPKESYPEWGEYGLVGHLQEYTLKGSVIKERWCLSNDVELRDNGDYVVSDFFHYDMRLVEAGNKTLYAGYWMAEDELVTSIPIFVRYAGGSKLFQKPEHQLNSFLYAYAKGEWDKRENLFWTYIFTAIYSQGLPGPVLLQDPDNQNETIKVDYRGGVKVITAKGKLENIQVIDGDVVQIKNLMEQQTGKSTIHEQIIGGQNESATFSGYVMSMNAGKLPAIDPKEAQEQAYRDAFLHILQRIKAEGIENDLISPEDIPDDIDIDVSMEPNLQQDDLRNAQIVAQLKGSGINISDEWLNTNLLKIADSEAMFRQRTKEQIRAGIIQNMMQNPQVMMQFVAMALGQPAAQPNVAPESGMPPEAMSGEMPGEMPTMPGMEGMPKTDAMIPPEERM